jgi:hypothetical protein
MSAPASGELRLGQAAGERLDPGVLGDNVPHGVDLDGGQIVRERAEPVGGRHRGAHARRVWGATTRTRRRRAAYPPSSFAWETALSKITNTASSAGGIGTAGRRVPAIDPDRAAPLDPSRRRTGPSGRRARRRTRARPIGTLWPSQPGRPSPPRGARGPSRSRPRATPSWRARSPGARRSRRRCSPRPRSARTVSRIDSNVPRRTASSRVRRRDRPG